MKISNQKSKFSSQESRKGKTNAEQQEEENNTESMKCKTKKPVKKAQKLAD